MLGLPDGIEACLFDLDGVLTKTAQVDAAAWKSTVDDCLTARAARLGQRDAFDAVEDCNEHVDGNSRQDGGRSFLAELLERP